MGTILFGLILLSITIPYVTQPLPWTFIDGANLIFHEAGHFLFAGFGAYLSVLGGTLLQLGVPLVCLLYFGKTKQVMGGLFCGWWMGVNLVNVGLYMADANTLSLPLIGDGTHDWLYLLSAVNLLSLAEIMGGFFRGIGTVVMIAAAVGATVSGIVWRR